MYQGWSGLCHLSLSVRGEGLVMVHINIPVVAIIQSLVISDVHGYHTTIATPSKCDQ